MSEPSTPDTTSADPLLGRTIDGRYSVESVLGEGGMGLVYRGHHAVLGRPVAIKVLRRDVSKDEVLIARFMREAQSASAIGNEHIVDILDFGRLPDGSTYFVMEYLDGQDLRDAIADEAPMPVPTALHIAKQLCRALGAAHAQGIVHRDIKPENVFLVTRRDALPFVKVLDFGVAKAGSNAMMRLTRTGHLLGTPLYMSPEQCAGAAVDHRTDLYAIGVVLYEMLSGVPPLDDDSVVRLLYKQLHEQPLPLSGLDPPIPVPAGLDSLVMRCLAKRASERYQTAEELLAALEAVDPRGGVAAAVPGVTPAAPPAAPARPPARSADTLDNVASVLARPSGPIALAHDTLLEPRLPRRRLPLLVGAGLAGALTVMIVIVWALASGSSPPARPATGPVPGGVALPGAGPAAGTGVGAPARPPAPASPVEEPPRTAITTDPAGAEVWLAGALVGNTPVSVPKPSGGETFELSIRAAGHMEERLVLMSDSADSLSIPLEQERPRPSRPPATAMVQAAMAPDPPPLDNPPSAMMRPAIDPGAELIDPFD